MSGDERLSDKLDRLATDKWPAILEAAGVDGRHLVNKAGPCPVCLEARPRFRFDNKAGKGTWICTCGYGDGIKLLMACTGKSFIEAAIWVIEQLEDPGRERSAIIRSREFVRTSDELTPMMIAQRRAMYRQTWQQAQKVTEGDPVWRYLTRRLPGLVEVPQVIRFHPGLEYLGPAKDGEKRAQRLGIHPVMLSAVLDDDGRCCNLHRTYLTREGNKLALVGDNGLEIPAKKLMPSIKEKSYAIRLAVHNGRLGIAEGVETALAAMLYKGLPTWSVVSTSGMKSFHVPADVFELTVFADNDKRTKQGIRPGFDAANKLLERDDVKARIRARTLKVKVITPARRGQDMANMLLEAVALKQAA